MIEALQPIERIRCPSCDYPLINLPTVHTCPECGFAYDPWCRVFIVHHRIATVSWLLILFLTGVCAFVAIDLAPRFRGLFICFGATLPFLPLLLSLGMHGRRRGRIFVNRIGIRFEPPRGATVEIPWSRIASARCNSLTGRFTLLDHSGQPIRCPAIQRLRTSRLGRQLAETCNTLAARYAEAGLIPPDTATPPLGAS